MAPHARPRFSAPRPGLDQSAYEQDGILAQNYLFNGKEAKAGTSHAAAEKGEQRHTYHENVQGHRPANSTSNASHSKQPASAREDKFKFVIIDHPEQLKNKTALRQNRQFVMHDYLRKEQSNPLSTDIRVTGGSQAQKKRKRDTVKTGQDDNWNGDAIFIPNSSRTIYHGPTASIPGPYVERCDSVVCESQGWSGTTSTTESLHADVDLLAPKKRQDSHHPLLQQAFICFTANYLGTNPDALRFPLSRFGGKINQLNTWPAFSRPGVDVARLKYLCSQRFGSASIGELWIPILINYRHAFLSTICISSTYDLIMRRATGAPSQRTIESVERMEVRSEVIAMINEHLSDPALQATDGTIIAVLQVLDSEVMTGNDLVLDVHQHGLRQLVAMRGGMHGLHRQVASVLTGSMHLIAILRERRPDDIYTEYALQQTLPLPSENEDMPENPACCRPAGFRKLRDVLGENSKTYNLLEHVRRATDSFLTASGLYEATYDSQQPLLDLRRLLTAKPAALDHRFLTSGQRHTEQVDEAVRWASIVYCHALEHNMPLSEAGGAMFASHHSLEVSQELENVQAMGRRKTVLVAIKEALCQTQLDKCWGPLAGVLFWVSLVGGAAASPAMHYGSNGSEGHHGDREARAFLAALAVRCFIVLGFDHQAAASTTLRQLVEVQRRLAHRHLDRAENARQFGQEQSGLCHESGVPDVTSTSADATQRSSRSSRQAMFQRQSRARVQQHLLVSHRPSKRSLEESSLASNPAPLQPKSFRDFALELGL